MTKYYFLRHNGSLYRLTKNAYRAWVKDSSKAKKALKVARYGTNVGVIGSIYSVTEFDNKDFDKMVRSWE